MPSKSKSQQRLMGLALAYKRGEVPGSKVSKSVKKLASSMSDKNLEGFASTKHKGIPTKVKQNENNTLLFDKKIGYCSETMLEKYSDFLRTNLKNKDSKTEYIFNVKSKGKVFPIKLDIGRKRDDDCFVFKIKKSDIDSISKGNGEIYRFNNILVRDKLSLEKYLKSKVLL